jgi:hypothetical protein
MLWKTKKLYPSCNPQGQEFIPVFFVDNYAVIWISNIVDVGLVGNIHIDELSSIIFI